MLQPMGTKGLIITGTLVGVAVVFHQPILAFIGKTKKAANIADNIQVKIKGASIVGFNQVNGKPTSDLLIKFNVQIYNYSGFDIPLKNMFIAWDKQDGQEWTNIGISQGYTDATLKNGQMQAIPFPFVINPSDLADVIAKGNTLNRVVTKWDFNSLPMSYTSTFKVSDYFSMAKVGNILNRVVDALKSINKTKTITTEQQRAYLIKVAKEDSKTIAAFNSMNSVEVADTYNFLVNYVAKSKKLEQSNPLWAKVQAISTKYNIFS